MSKLTISEIVHADELIAACRSGDLNALERALATNQVDVNLRTQHGRLPLVVAVEEGHVAVVERLLQIESLDVNKYTLPGGSRMSEQPALWAACFWGHSKIVAALLRDKRTNVNLKFEKASPLQVACAKGHADVVKILLQAPGINIDTSPAESKKSLLQLACGKGHAKVVGVLASDPRFDINSRSQNGKTPLMTAIEIGCTPLVKMILQVAGVEVDALNGKEKSALWQACKLGRVEEVRLLLGAGANINKPGMYYFLTASVWDQADVIKVLSAADASRLDEPYLPEPYLPGAYLPGTYLPGAYLPGTTALNYAICRWKTGVMQALFEAGADLARVQRGQQHPLVKAIWRDDEDVVKMILTMGQDMSILQKSGGDFDKVSMLLIFEQNISTVRHIGQYFIQQAEAKGLQGIANLLRSAQLLFACAGNDVAAVTKLLKDGADVNFASQVRAPMLPGGDSARHQNFPLLAAVKAGNRDVVALLLQQPSIERSLIAAGTDLLGIAKKHEDLAIYNNLKDRLRSSLRSPATTVFTQAPALPEATKLRELAM